jgi:hypothetical protein
LAHCPVELNLMPQSSIQRQEFGSKKPYLVGSVFALALVVFVIYIAERRIGTVLSDRLEQAKAPLDSLTKQTQQLKSALSERDQLSKQADQLRDLAESRYAWTQVLTALRSVLMEAESSEKAALTTPDNGGTNTDAGIWIEVFDPVLPAGSFFSAGDEAGAVGGISARGNRNQRRNTRNGPGARLPTVPLMASGETVDLGSISEINLSCRGVNRASVSPNANMDLAFQVQHGLTNNPTFKQATLQGDLTVDAGNTNTFSFSLLVRLTHPLKL